MSGQKRTHSIAEQVFNWLHIRSLCETGTSKKTDRLESND